MYVTVRGLRVDADLHRFLTEEAFPGSGAEPDEFWDGLSVAVARLEPRRQALLRRREELQAQIDQFHRDRPGPLDRDAYEKFLREIDYLVDVPQPFEVTTSDVDPEIATLAGPQLVVPIDNARFATNAANARWGSLYDAFYGTDVIASDGEMAAGAAYNPLRGAEVIRRARAFLDEWVPLAGASHFEVAGYSVDSDGLAAMLSSGAVARLADSGQLVGYRGERSEPSALVLRHHGLHLEILVDRGHRIGAVDPAGVSDVLLESALTTIMDLEDSVAAVDPADKVACYRNWLRLMQGALAEEVTKNGETFLRTMNQDRTCVSLAGEPVTIPGRSVLFVRHVGHLMSTSAVTDASGEPISEGILDAFVTGLGSCHDLRGNSRLQNSRTGSMYAVKPKMHGPDEVALTVDLFELVERSLGLPANTIKVGIMDEERRTTLNLAACIAAARDRVAFINTGFLDRTGDEIHTSMWAGPVVRKNAMRSEAWISAYEQANVNVGLACGLAGRAQIGKGMWAAPENMADMLEQKIGHPQAGASTAWVPSPTAATLHAIHYHQVDVAARQAELSTGGARAELGELLSVPLGDPAEWTAEERRAELDNNVQGVLGYVVRWIDRGVGCSKVPDITGTPLMEDRATCRISSQHIANWLHHGVITIDQIDESLMRMAAVVDGQNADQDDYRPMAPAFEGNAFLAARALLVEGASQPSGYTEPILHSFRAREKAGDRALETTT
ncbi:malate synthase G [Dactylosporangium sp. NPDC051485]|uniref:malate synthase G n=1 Tax=Dactylosporangium sp. NPDC051485 TaxID=3154846 RepID=UPI00341D4323